ncbi:hypothetical protein SDJN03_22069, partial [Cucurbita argyrosperma subsp. sororia]
MHNVSWEITRVHDGGVPAVTGGSGRRTPCEGTRVHGSGIVEQSETGERLTTMQKQPANPTATPAGSYTCCSFFLLTMIQDRSRLRRRLILRHPDSGGGRK